MTITPEIDHWLTSSGYEYHCFISWVHVENSRYTDLAKRIKSEIQEALALSIPNPRVFLDESEIIGGTIWKEKLRRALCKSIAMVSLCIPIYYHPEHLWCGLEWAAMENLSKRRLPNEDFRSIIPLMLKRDDNLPSALQTIQYIDFSAVFQRCNYYYRTNEFKSMIRQIVERIESISKAIAFSNSIADCSEFELPIKSAFIDYQIREQGLPFRTS